MRATTKTDVRSVKGQWNRIKSHAVLGCWISVNQGCLGSQVMWFSYLARYNSYFFNMSNLCRFSLKVEYLNLFFTIGTIILANEQ